MGDLKIFAANDNQLASVIKIINKFSNDIEMSFGIDCNWTQTHNHLVPKWLSVRLQTKWLWVQVQWQPLNFRFRACFKQGVP